MTRNWVANYAGRQRPGDFGTYVVARPAGGFLFDQAQRQHISYFNYGEGFAGLSTMPDRDRSPALLKEEQLIAAHSDFGPDITPGGCYASDLHIGSIGAGPTNGEIFDSTLPAGAPSGSNSHLSCFLKRFDQQLDRRDVPMFNYLSFTNDHTRGTQPLSDGLATPMYNVFSSKPVNSDRVNTIRPGIKLLARNGPSAALAQASSRLPLGTPDAVPQRQLDSIIWRSVYGANSTPPPPGPGAGNDQ